MKFNKIGLWFGSEESLQACMSAEDKLQDPAHMANLLALRGDEDEESDTSHLLSKIGSTSVVNITGPLVNNDAWYNKYLGVVGYGEIRDAIIEAVQDTSTDAILLDINSGGGAAMGVQDLSDFIMDVDAKHKPVIAYSSNVMASAAYWIGASARQVFSSKSAIVGSIGVIAVHHDMTGALEQAGVKATVVRAGKFKALGTPFEKLEGEALEAWQNRANSMYDFFIDHVANARGTNKTMVDTFMAQGREFFGERATEAGLLDGNISFDDLLKKMQGGIDFPTASNKYANNLITGIPMKHRRTITAQAAAQVAAMPAAETQPNEQQLATALEAADLQADIDAAQVETQAETAEVEAEAPTDNSEASADVQRVQAVVDYLKGENASLNAELASARARLQAENTRVEQLNAEIAGLRGIAEASVSRLQVALKMGRGVAEMSTEALLATHDNLRKQFETQFKAGGVAAVATTEHRESPGEAVSSVRAARLSATRLNK